jgi:hypothetical protein
MALGRVRSQEADGSRDGYRVWFEVDPGWQPLGAPSWR